MVSGDVALLLLPSAALDGFPSMPAAAADSRQAVNLACLLRIPCGKQAKTPPGLQPQHPTL